MLISCLAYSLTLKMEVVWFSKMSVDCPWTTWHYAPHNRNLHCQCCGNLKFNKIDIVVSEAVMQLETTSDQNTWPEALIHIVTGYQNACTQQKLGSTEILKRCPLLSKTTSPSVSWQWTHKQESEITTGIAASQWEYKRKYPMNIPDLVSQLAMVKCQGNKNMKTREKN
jgi:hypothetical protein